MPLRTFRVSAQIAVSDLARAVDFYEGKLGLSPSRNQHKGTRTPGSGIRMGILLRSSSRFDRDVPPEGNELTRLQR